MLISVKKKKKKFSFLRAQMSLERCFFPVHIVKIIVGICRKNFMLI